LGKLCGLLPGFTPTSDQLHTVVLLSAGIIGDNIVDEDELKELQLEEQTKKSHSPNRRPKQSATERLKEALGSNKAFQKLYLVSELNIYLQFAYYTYNSIFRVAKNQGSTQRFPNSRSPTFK
jgi:hypothetical protein